jgi:hypothetical protein
MTTRRGLETQLRTSANAAAIEYDRRFGLAGVAEYYLDLYASSGDRAMLDRARRIADVIVSRATVNGDAMHWVAPRLAFMQDAGTPGAMTGLFHGAAGYGLLLLRLDAAIRQRPWTLRFPDSLE